MSNGMLTCNSILKICNIVFTVYEFLRGHGFSVNRFDILGKLHRSPLVQYFIQGRHFCAVTPAAVMKCEIDKWKSFTSMLTDTVTAQLSFPQPVIDLVLAYIPTVTLCREVDFIRIKTTHCLQAVHNIERGALEYILASLRYECRSFIFSVAQQLGNEGALRGVIDDNVCSDYNCWCSGCVQICSCGDFVHFCTCFWSEGCIKFNGTDISHQNFFF